ncbi:putative Transmembrane protein [Quillaja saponaria]|uniref:Transmembrane protein n=1 Tax=Quillaja saponaria TaxID=32244 RepID=A0AAD7QEM2_QUISA|nr:putative Transmembrane protein [Quillaja saponaria]
MSLLNLVLALVLLLTLTLHLQPTQASRELHDKGKLIDKELVMQSLPKGPVPPSGPSGCTYIPGSGGTSCPVKQMNVAGNVFSRARGYPRLTVPLGVATNSQKL